jgi:glycosyltransferase involved in cell wall biosynthesis
VRLAFVSTMFLTPWGGSEELWADAAEAALAAGHEVHLFLYRWPDTPQRVQELERAGARLHLRARHDATLGRQVLLAGARRTGDWPLPSRLSAFRDLAALRPDMVCVSQGDVYSGVRENTALVRWLRRSGTRYVVIVHFTTDNEVVHDHERRAAHDFLERAEAVAFVSDGNRRMAERQLAVSVPHATVVRNPVNIPDRSIVPWPPSERMEMATVGRLHVYAKGQDALFEALGSPHWSERDWRLTLYGTGWDERYLRELARHYGIEGRVVFAGHTSEVRAIWQHAHLLVMPSRAEGLPLALVEAMLCGRPALLTDVGGHREWVTEGETGWIAAAPTAIELDGALERAWSARADWETMGREAHEVATRLSDERPGESLLELLELYAGSSRSAS